MDYKVTVRDRTIFVNKKATKSLMGHSGGYRLIGETYNGKVVKAGFSQR